MKARTLLPLLLVASLAACSSSDDSDDGGTGGDTGNTSGDTGGDTGETGGDTGGTGGDTGGTGGTGGNPDGEAPGVWYGDNGFGDTVLVIESDNDIYSYSAGTGFYETTFGAIGSEAERRIHRDSDNPAHGDSFTLVGDAPSDSPTTVTYDLTVTNDGQQIDNTGDAGDFSLTFATDGDVEAISVADVVGTWQAQTSFSANDNLLLSITIAANGTVTGFTDYQNGSIPDGVDNAEGDFFAPITGTVTADGDSDLFLSIAFNWNTFDKEGVLFMDRTSSKLVLNAGGTEEGEFKSFSALLTEQ